MCPVWSSGGVVSSVVCVRENDYKLVCELMGRYWFCDFVCVGVCVSSGQMKGKEELWPGGGLAWLS